LGLDDFSLDEMDKSFFLEAAKTIYDWLPVDKKIKLVLELSNEGVSSIEELRGRERFFRLLHFLEVNYVMPASWAKRTIESLKTISRAQHTPDIQTLKIELEEVGSLDGVSEKLKESGVTELFYSTIEKLEVKNQYNSYLVSKKGAAKHE
jgi:hypothetical protein